MQKLIKRLQSSESFKKVNYYSLIVFFFLYIFSVPSFGSRDGWNYIVYAIMALLSFLVASYYLLYKKVSFNKWFLPVPCFALFSIIGTVLYSHQYRSFLTLLLLVFSFFIIYCTYAIMNNRRMIVVIMVAALFAFSGYYIFVYRGQIFDFESYVNGNIRLGAFFDGQNAISAFAIIMYILSFYSLLFFNKKYRFLFVFSIISSMIVGISTGSRTFIVAFVVISLVILFFRLKKHIITYFLIVGIFVSIVIIMFSLPFMTTLRDRFIRIFWTFFTDSSRVDTSTLQRMIWLDYGFYLGNKHMLFGTGPYGFGVLSGLNTYTHSNFSEVWCDFGLIGFILFYLPLVICVVHSFRTRNKNASIIASIFVYYILVSFSNVFYYFKFYYLILAFCYYLAFCDNNDKIYINIDNLFGKCKTIAITCEGMESGGAERVIADLSNNLVSKGYEIVIIGVSTHNTNSFYPLDNRVKYITIHNGQSKKINPFKRIMLLRKTIKSVGPNVIISFLPHVNVYTYFATIGMKIPVIDSERNNPKADPKGFVLRAFKKIAFYQADGAVFQTNASKYYFRKEVRDKSTIILNPVDPRTMHIHSERKKNKVILSVGRLTEQKNHKLLLDAFKTFSTKHPDYILRIYGEGELHNELAEYSKKLGIDAKFELLSPDYNWLEKEKDDSMFILSSNYEGMPNALLEAMCVGIPCISTNCPSGGPYELIKNGVNGYLTNVGDVNELGARMEDLLSNPLLYDIEEYKANYSINKISDEWLEYIKLVMERKLST